MIPEDRLQQLIKTKKGAEAQHWCNKYGYSEGWAIIDGSLVIYDIDNPPAWLAPVLAVQDEDGNTEIAGVTLMREPREGEYEDPRPALVPLETEAAV